ATICSRNSGGYGGLVLGIGGLLSLRRDEVSTKRGQLHVVSAWTAGGEDAERVRGPDPPLQGEAPAPAHKSAVEAGRMGHRERVGAGPADDRGAGDGASGPHLRRDGAAPRRLTSRTHRQSGAQNCEGEGGGGCGRRAQPVR